MSQPHDFPFDITDVAELLHLRIRRPSPQGLYVDCPICNDKRGKMHINTQTDTWRCNYCDESGGMLALYAKVHSISTSTAYREISDALLMRSSTRISRRKRRSKLRLLPTLPCAIRPIPHFLLC